MKLWVFLFLILCLPVFSFSFRLKERVDKAKPGDYIVTEAGKMITILTIRVAQPNSLVIEEISAPTQSLKKRPDSWVDWIKANAPGHTSWSMVEIDPQTGSLLECFSFSKSCWIHLSQKDSLISTLLHLPLTKVSIDKQHKIGPPPMSGEPDFRKVWAPPFVYEGKKIDSPPFEVYETVWPKDESELSGEKVLLYFDLEKKLPFPFWIQVETSHATAALRTLDSGKNLPAVYRKIPRRVPEFVGLPKRVENQLLLNLKSPKYYKQFELYAIDVTTREKKQILPVTHSLLDGEGEWKTVAVDLNELDQTLQIDHSYTWLLVPVGFSDSYTETAKPFTWTP